MIDTAKIEDALEKFREKVAARSEGREIQGSVPTMHELRQARDAVLVAARQAVFPSRRERIATAALQGLLAASETDARLALAYEEAAVTATRYADALIAQLDEGCPVRPTVHVVTPGETLSGIALRYYGDADRWPALAKVNRLWNPDHIEPGWTIAIPKELP